MRTWMLWRTSENKWVSPDNTDDGIGDPKRVIELEPVLDLVMRLLAPDRALAIVDAEALLREHGRETR